MHLTRRVTPLSRCGYVENSTAEQLCPKVLGCSILHVSRHVRKALVTYYTNVSYLRRLASSACYMALQSERPYACQPGHQSSNRFDAFAIICGNVSVQGPSCTDRAVRQLDHRRSVNLLGGPARAAAESKLSF